MRKCRVCGKRDGRSESCSFHRVPTTDEALLEKWSQSVGISLEKNQYVCEDHFFPSHIVEGNKKNFLLPGAIPIRGNPRKRSRLDKDCASIDCQSDIGFQEKEMVENEKQ
ncbi:uncharacterized protein LOC142238637 [Haematobia irritans]|uniref:uncharacterized protein LOC142238637 n=1 Tax=Haematobia irritans TaxID=7368 RepID=UPI003F4FD588